MRTLRCRKCKKIFEFTTVGQLCPSCMTLEEMNFQKVRTFIKDNPGFAVSDISKATGVPPTRILSYIKEERLEVICGSTSIKCKNCSTPITTGMFCDSCKKAITPKLENKPTFADTYVEKEGKGIAGTASSMRKDID